MRKTGFKSKPGDLTCRKYMFGRLLIKQKVQMDPKPPGEDM